ncbi:MAG: GTP 3',8-cyclase MoaA [Deltaproteobacteria bacterium]|nr:GTP 3',8-cyclase MoaA [Deltaproteobacteria bacterium]
MQTSRLRIISPEAPPGDLSGMSLPERNIDRFGRTIDYMRISITDRCNLRCVYCMPEEGVELHPRDELLRFEEICRVAASARRLGFRKFRVTGGEPLVVRDVLVLLREVRRATEGATLALTTNGVRLAEMAAAVRAAGVERLNISLDTLDRERFRALSRRDNLGEVLAGIEAALAVGYARIKINAVIVRGINEVDLIPLAALARERPIDVRFIEQMPLDGQPDHGFLGADEMVRRISAVFPLTAMAPEDPRQAAQLMYRSEALRGFIGIVAPRSKKFCATCNRLRLTPNGELKGCLLSEGTLDLRAALRSGVTDAHLDDLLRYAIGIKPLEYRNERYGLDRPMSAIGG